jgi:hypothetical protein
MYLAKFFHSETGKHMLSIILGLGLASLFRTVCKEKNCIIFKAPPLADIKDKVFKQNDKCYKYTPVSRKCDASKKIVEFA